MKLRKAGGKKKAAPKKKKKKMTTKRALLHALSPFASMLAHKAKKK